MRTLSFSNIHSFVHLLIQKRKIEETQRIEVLSEKHIVT